MLPLIGWTWSDSCGPWHRAYLCYCTTSTRHACLCMLSLRRATATAAAVAACVVVMCFQCCECMLAEHQAAQHDSGHSTCLYCCCCCCWCCVQGYFWCCRCCCSLLPRRSSASCLRRCSQQRPCPSRRCFRCWLLQHATCRMSCCHNCLTSGSGACGGAACVCGTCVGRVRRAAVAHAAAAFPLLSPSPDLHTTGLHSHR
jgi:hypothetical protein